MNYIHVLDERTANQIAAGEVVERPASIVKELVENAIDAGSSFIHIDIIAGGIEFIRVTDNGGGMSKLDLEKAVLRHATSKIQQIDDLDSLVTLGFRGEALPSIAAVSRMEISTRLLQDSMGSFLKITGGIVSDVTECGCAPGTIVTVSDLFFNTPARKKFLKTATAEGNRIQQLVGKMALANPKIAFKLVVNDKRVLETPGTGELSEAITALFGPAVGTELLAVNREQEGIQITGFVGKPHLLKGTRQWQTFVVNGRVVQNFMLSKAIDQAYHSLLPKVGFPFTALFLHIEPSCLDVNVHPQKSEVKFSDEQIAYRAMYHGIREAITAGKENYGQIATPLELTDKKGETYISSSLPLSDNTSKLPVSSPSYITRDKEKELYWKEEERVKEEGPSWNEIRQWKEQADHVALDKSIFESVSEDTVAGSSEMELHPLGQIADCFIIAEGRDGLYIIDQHAAHERILYDKLHSQIGHVPVQELLMPVFVNLTEAELELIETTQETWESLGFSLKPAGPGLARVTALPADVSDAGAEQMIREILDRLSQFEQVQQGELRHSILQTASCRHAIKAGEELNMRQMQKLIAELQQTQLPFTCPHGRPAVIHFSPESLAKFFKRT